MLQYSANEVLPKSCLLTQTTQLIDMMHSSSIAIDSFPFGVFDTRRINLSGIKYALLSRYRWVCIEQYISMGYIWQRGFMVLLYETYFYKIEGK